MSRYPFAMAMARRLVAPFALALLAGCGTTLDREHLNYDGVVSRMAVEGNTPSTSDGPRCFGKSMETGGKASAGPRAKGTAARSYRVGPGDELRFNIFGEEGMRDLTARVDAEGFVQLPIVEAVRVSGRTTREIQADLKALYAVQFQEPWVTVELAHAESHPIYFLGEFREPGVKHMEFATELIEALALAEGLEEDAYLPGARLIRRDHVCTVDLAALLRNGDFSQNVWMQSGDILFAPRKEDMRVYVLGAVGTPQAVPFGEDGRRLLETLSMAGGPDEGASALGDVRIVRSHSATRGELIVVDVAAMLKGDKLDFPLQPGDVVYVPKNALGSWNQAIDQILPSLQLISGILTPFALIDSLQK
ncbi:polysaccharide biosynthesis/export family protein [Aliiruegeria lutimaris]|uniref:Polysaccharide export outer membrane protein n=1 Tax=Aliiruegeria lutimaris TaxID=571298 RepID=A0A1G8WL25_9RHOB|nr:polysaccharide biosynthesis/export family protein [Aliiruegeria lutimaris]SDJ79049.1 polysaccharide export outer membrane protein [Aliiruegeria lutimaris]